MKLSRNFYLKNTLVVCKELLGKVLVYNDMSGIISEVEAYRGTGDDACHAARGMTPRNKPMFEAGGFSYIYFIYGMYHCMNISTEKEGFPAAVLLRGIVPLEGKEKMIINRGGKTKAISNGPGKLCQALGLDKTSNNIDLVTSDFFYVEDRGIKPKTIHTSPRIGISTAQDLEWRFFAKEFL
ncbi:MAG: DNA-3-methyladenine glycosylase [Nitrospinae bacterium]|nr:DNA-3-methyladenine glycosylase [Nitrospinota bacterium]